jgi:putative ABC transport system permease protein
MAGVQPAMQDLRYALRLLRRSPGFTIAAVTVLALGIGANTAIFSVVDATLLRPLPFPKPGALVMLWEAPPGYVHNRVSPLNFQDWHDSNSVFAGLAAVSGGSRTMPTRTGAERIPGQSVTAEFFSTLGVRPIAGRTFSPEDERTRASVVVLSEGFWRNRFGADTTLVGRAITLDGRPYTVIGIVPTGFQILYPADQWTLFVPRRGPEQRRMHYLQVIGRLKTGVTMEQAKAALSGIATHIAEISPESNRGWGVTIEPLRQALVGNELRSTSLALAGVVLFVLLMACANVASLVLARGAARSRELAVRVSLGAGGARLARQLLTESLVLATMGGAAGIALAAALIRIAPALIPPDTLPTGMVLTLDGRVLAFTLAATLATGILFGLVPAWQVARGAVADSLRGGGRGIAGGNARTLGVLAAVEIAVALIVVTGAGLFLRTLERLSQVDPGYHAERVLTARLSLPLATYKTQARCLEFYVAAQREIESLPGIRSAAFGGSVPLTGFEIGQGFEVRGAASRPESLRASAHYQIVGARYFETLGIPLESGRAFTDRDVESAPQVAIVNREFVRRYLGGRDPIGAHVIVQAMDMGGPKPVDREIVGVSGQVKLDSPGERESAVEIYVPITQNPWFDATIAIRAEAAPEQLTAGLRAAIARIDKDLALTRIRTMDEIAANAVARPRFRARLLAGFAAVALLLSAVGVFGVLAFSVSRRRREFGIRMALGAQAQGVLSLVLCRAAKIAIVGLMAGLAGAALLARGLGTLLYGVRPDDPATFTTAALVLGFVTLLAAAIPAWRAATVDPATVLREE